MPRPCLVGAVALLVSVPLFAVMAQTKATKKVKRVAPPKFGAAEGPFYADAFREGLVGQRPATLGQPAAGVAATAPSTGGSSSSGSGTGGVAGSGWSGLISATTIEDAIKSLKLQVDQNITTPSDFAGKGYKVARRDFTMLALLLGIAGEYEGDVRWKRDAPAARDTFARTAANAKVGTQQVWQEAKMRKDELADLLNGNSPFGGKEAEVKANWGQVVGRAPLMQYLEQAWEPKLKPALADKNQFNANAEKVLYEAELLAAIGHVMVQPGMPDADDDEYQSFSHRLRDGAKAVADAVKTKNYEQAAAASATITKACADCHDNYRG